MKYLSLSVLLLITALSQAQDTTYQNTGTSMINSSNKLSIRGYAEGNYNQPFAKDERSNGKLEMRRMVLFTGYKFNERTSFVAEIEVEHGNQIFLEQAFVNHRLHKNINLRAGLLLIPMGIVNEYHEPTSFNGVERPNMDKYIITSTWREMGIGFQGIIPEASISYQVYAVNGFKSHNGEEGLINENSGFRGGRQKGVGSIMSSPNLSAKVDYFGIRNFKLGLATYMGQTQSPLYDGLSVSDDSSMRAADSSVLGLQMFGMDARYTYKRLKLRGQAVIGKLNNTAAYNGFTSSNLSSRMYGYYAELAYNVLPSNAKYQLYPFVRWEEYDTQANDLEQATEDKSKRSEITAGLSWFLHPGAVIKTDYQRFERAGSLNHQFNLGIGIWF